MSNTTSSSSFYSNSILRSCSTPGAQFADDGKLHKIKMDLIWINIVLAGVILSAVLSRAEETKGYLLILDAKSFKEIARANYESNAPLTNDFHGIFMQ